MRIQTLTALCSARRSSTHRAASPRADAPLRVLGSTAPGEGSGRARRESSTVILLSVRLALDIISRGIAPLTSSEEGRFAEPTTLHPKSAMTASTLRQHYTNSEVRSRSAELQLETSHGSRARAPPTMSVRTRASRSSSGPAALRREDYNDGNATCLPTAARRPAEDENLRRATTRVETRQALCISCAGNREKIQNLDSKRRRFTPAKQSQLDAREAESCSLVLRRRHAWVTADGPRGKGARPDLRCESKLRPSGPDSYRLGDNSALTTSSERIDRATEHRRPSLHYRRRVSSAAREFHRSYRSQKRSRRRGLGDELDLPGLALVMRAQQSRQASITRCKSPPSSYALRLKPGGTPSFEPIAETPFRLPTAGKPHPKTHQQIPTSPHAVSPPPASE